MKHEVEVMMTSRQRGKTCQAILQAAENNWLIVTPSVAQATHIMRLSDKLGRGKVRVVLFEDFLDPDEREAILAQESGIIFDGIDEMLLLLCKPEEAEKSKLKFITLNDTSANKET